MATPLSASQHDDPDGALSSLPSEATPERYKRAFGNHPAGVAVITAVSPTGVFAALTATSVSSVSAEPPLLVFSLSALSSSTPVLREADTVVVHLLQADDIDLAKLCATSGIDRFADHQSWKRLATGEPVFTSASTWLRAKVISQFDAGLSTLMVVQALQITVPEPDAVRAPLVYHNRSWHSLGECSALPSTLPVP